MSFPRINPDVLFTDDEAGNTIEPLFVLQEPAAGSSDISHSQSQGSVHPLTSDSTIPPQNPSIQSELPSGAGGGLNRKQRLNKRSFDKLFFFLSIVFFPIALCVSREFRASFCRLFRPTSPVQRIIPFPATSEDESKPPGKGAQSVHSLRKKRSKLFPENSVHNRKYSLISFLPVVLYEQFKIFLNLYFLLIALSQIFPILRIGELVTYFAPLGFVLAVSIIKEALEDLKRRRRDTEVNSRLYTILDPISLTEKAVPCNALRVGDFVVIKQDERIPADIVLLRSRGKNGTCFVRTDQLDGETDWKVRIALQRTQGLGGDSELFTFRGHIEAEPPSISIYSFCGTMADIERNNIVPIACENMLWMNSVLASDSIVGMVLYTGPETRAVMNSGKARIKFGLLDFEVNRLSKILCVVTIFLAASMVLLSSIADWTVGLLYFVRFMILFSSIIPMSLLVNLEVAKVVFSYFIRKDEQIAGTIVRTSSIPEELGRVQFLLTDKTGTLTKNEMDLKKLHIGTMSFNTESFDEVRDLVTEAFRRRRRLSSIAAPGGATSSVRDTIRTTGSLGSRVHEVLLAIALCHNVNPISHTAAEDKTGIISASGHMPVEYESASPDETALVKWANEMRVSLIARELHSMRLLVADEITLDFEILHVFPFTSESKRMGILLRDMATREIVFYQKGADSVMSGFVLFNDWLAEECDNMAREGLRTLVLARKRISEELYERFNQELKAAKTSFLRRNEEVASVVSKHLEFDMELLGLTGVEDKLQDDVRPTLEMLRNAGIRIWMLTGDKIETAKSIALSSKLVPRKMPFCAISSDKIRSPEDAINLIAMYESYPEGCLIIDGTTLALCLEHCLDQFLSLATKLSTVVCCRCSPTQKAQITSLIIKKSKMRVASIGDGGNDVGMIQAAHVGIGIVGKEGLQASLASDFSITKFSHVGRLLLWHGRNSYRRSAKLSQVVIHRGLIITVMQAVFSSVFYYAPMGLFQGYLLMGYTTFYTNAPLFFPIVWDTDVTPEIALLFPELYKDLVRGKYLSYKTFFLWLFVSVYQGAAIMIVALHLFKGELRHIISISFSALILNELIIYMLEIVSWPRVTAPAFIFSILTFLTSIWWVPEFDARFMFNETFLWKVLLITTIAALPLVAVKKIKQFFLPPSYQKLVNHN